MNVVQIDVNQLPAFRADRVHRRRARSLYKAPLLIVQKAPPAAVGRIRTAVTDSDLAFSTSFYGYSAFRHPEGQALVRYLSLLIGSKLALWQALITSGEFGFERDTIEKSTIDGLLAPPFEALSIVNLDKMFTLFNAAQSRDPGAWAAVDEWVAELCGLRHRDLQIIVDTLAYNLPFAKNRRQAQVPPSEEAVKRFCTVIEHELRPWAERFGRVIKAEPAIRLGASPWRSLRICSGEACQTRSSPSLNWESVLPVADHFAATEITFLEGDEGLWLGRLDQARYWSESQARQVAQQIAWEHVDVLRGRTVA